MESTTAETKKRLARVDCVRLDFRTRLARAREKMFRKLKHTVADGIKEAHIAVASSSASSALSVVDVDAVRGARADVDVEPRLVAHYGCDASTSAVTHVKHQGIILLTTQHGVKAIGSAGFEALFPCRSGVGARAEAKFAPGANRIYRASYDDGGTLASWDARDLRLLSCNHVELADGADVTCVTPLRGTAFTLAGDALGNVSVLRVGFDAQSQTTQAKVRPGYRITAQEALHRVIDTSRARMRVVAIEQQPGLINECSRVLIAWADGSMAVWHLHERRSVAVTAPATKSDVGNDDDAVSDDDGGTTLTTTTCATWLDANTFVSGRSDGSVVTHSVPELMGCTVTHEITRAQDLIWPYKIIDSSYSGTALMGIRALRTVVSDDGDGVRLTRNALVVVGGEPRAAPDPVIALTLVREKRAESSLGYRIDTTRAKALAWFGPVIDAAPMCDRDDGVVECIAVLSEGGRVHVHDVREQLNRGESVPQSQPLPLSPPHEALLSRPMFALTCAPSACAASREVEFMFRSNAACLDIPRATTDAAHGWCGSCRWPVYGGGGSDAGAVDGAGARVIVGAGGTSGSGLLVYLDVGGRLIPGGSVLANGVPITCVHVHAGGALIVVGRANGGVEVYAMRAYDIRHLKSRERVFARRLEVDAAISAEEEREFNAEDTRAFVDVDSASACMTSVYTLIGTFAHETHVNRRVTSARSNASATMVAIGDVAGGVSVIDLHRGAVAWSAPPPPASSASSSSNSKIDVSQACAGVAAFGFGLPLPERPDDDVLAVLDVESGVRFHALRTGTRIGTPMRPKSPTAALSIALLKLDGSPADACSPSSSSSSSAGWFTPPADFAYSFLAAEFTVDDDVDDEDKVLSTDEDESDVPAPSIPKRTALVATIGVNALRVYSALGCARGERFTLRKIRLDEPLVSAEVVRGGDFGHSRDECCVVALTSYGRLLAYALPSFAPLGAPFGPVPALSNANFTAFANDGTGVVVTDEGATIARLETFPSDSAPAAGRVIDDDVAAAAEAARVARFAMEENNCEIAMETTSKRASTVGTPSATSASPAGGTPLRNRMLMLRDRAKVAIEKLATVTPTKDDASHKHRDEPTYTTTDLALLFADVQLDAPSPLGKMQPTESSERAELFAGSSSRSSSNVDVAPVKRSAHDIRAKYRASDAAASSSTTASSVSQTRDQMLETRDKLVERGETLSRIQDKSANLERDAASFADMCAEIRKKSERSWL